MVDACGGEEPFPPVRWLTPSPVADGPYPLANDSLSPATTAASTSLPVLCAVYT